MSYRKIEMFEYRQIIYQMRQGLSDRAIAQQKLVGRQKCHVIRTIALARGWLNPEAALPDDAELAQVFAPPARPHQSISSVAAYKKDVLEWHNQGILGTVIHRTLVNRFGFTGSYDAVRRFIKHHTGTLTATVPLDFAPAEAAQVDFGKGPEITDDLTGKPYKTWFFVMTLCFSRHMYVEIVRDQRVETWLGCHQRAFEFFGGVPERIIIDNAKCAITKACRYEPEVQRAYADYAQGYGFIIAACPPREPQLKGRVEAGVKYVKRSFLPLRSFRSLGDANTQAQQWVLSEAGNRKHGTTYQKPLTCFTDIEQHLLKRLPERPPQRAVWAKVKVHGDCHIQYVKCRYSVPYCYLHQYLWLRATENTIQLYHQHELVAMHHRQQIPGQRRTLNEHLPPNAKAYLMRDPSWCRQQAAAMGEACLQVVETLFQDNVLDNLRAVQGILRLATKYGSSRLNAACKRAIAFNSCRYRTIKKMLDNGVEYEPLPESISFDWLGNAYTQGRFIRPIKDIKH